MYDRPALREFGIFIPVGAKRAVTAIREALEELRCHALTPPVS